MLKRTRSLAVALVTLCAACSGSLPDQTKVHGSLPPNTRSVAIWPMAMTPGTVKNVEGVDDAPLVFARFLKDALAGKHPTWLVELWEGPTSPPEADLVIKTELIDIEGGSQADRFWIGFGAGAAHSTAQVAVLDSAGNEVARARLSEATVCPGGGCVAANKTVIERDLETLAAKFADFISNLGEFAKK